MCVCNAQMTSLSDNIRECDSFVGSNFLTPSLLSHPSPFDCSFDDLATNLRSKKKKKTTQLLSRVRVKRSCQCCIGKDVRSEYSLYPIDTYRQAVKIGKFLLPITGTETPSFLPSTAAILIGSFRELNEHNTLSFVQSHVELAESESDGEDFGRPIPLLREGFIYRQGFISPLRSVSYFAITISHYPSRDRVSSSLPSYSSPLTSIYAYQNIIAPAPSCAGCIEIHFESPFEVKQSSAINHHAIVNHSLNTTDKIIVRVMNVNVRVKKVNRVWSGGLSPGHLFDSTNCAIYFTRA